MSERGNTIEFSKEFLKRIKIITSLENTSIKKFCTEKLDEVLKKYEEKYKLNEITKQK